MTGRAIGRQHRFVPKPKTVQTLWYCLAVAAHKYDVQLHGFVWMSNHYHIVLTDSARQLPDFMRDLNSLISKALNAIRGIRGENYARRGYHALVVSDGAKALLHCAYTEANPCRAHLVGSAETWESVTSAKLDYGQTVTIQRPDYGLWSGAKNNNKGRMNPHRAEYCGRIKCPAVASFRLVRPPCIDGSSPEQARTQVRKQVRTFEQEAREQREALAIGVKGMKRVRKVRYYSSPSNREAHFETEPEVSGEDPELRRSIRNELRSFVNMYRNALDTYKRKGHAIFPLGTWWMQRCLNANCGCPSG